MINNESLFFCPHYGAFDSSCSLYKGAFDRAFSPDDFFQQMFSQKNQLPEGLPGGRGTGPGSMQESDGNNLK